MSALRSIRLPALALRPHAQVPRLQHNLEIEMNDEKRKSFDEVARPMIKWLCENVHPHHSVIVTPTGAELLEGSATTGRVLDYVQD